jgi:hypothetical protein
MNILQEYYETKLALDILTKELDQKKEAVIEHLKAKVDHKDEIAGARFSLRRSFSYEYTAKTMQKASQIDFDLTDHREAIKEGENFIKGMKAQEVEDGSATLLSTTFSPIMTPIKESLKKGGK